MELVRCSSAFAARPFIASKGFVPLPPSAPPRGRAPVSAALAARAATAAQTSPKAPLSKGKTASACSISAAAESAELYGLVTTSSSSAGNTEAVKRNTSGYSSASAPSRYEPRPDPVPPPSECSSRKLCRLSHASTGRRTDSISASWYLGPARVGACQQNAAHCEEGSGRGARAAARERRARTVVVRAARPVVAAAADAADELRRVETVACKRGTCQRNAKRACAARGARAERAPEQLAHHALLHVHQHGARLRRRVSQRVSAGNAAQTTRCTALRSGAITPRLAKRAPARHT
jgi:hypothetical protein